MLVQDLKKAAMMAAKDNDSVKKDILRVALGEMQTAEARTNQALTDEEACAVLRKLVKSNEETLGVASSPEQKATLTREIEVLKAFLPTQLSPEQIVSSLASLHESIRGAASEGQAIGMAMKHVKSTKLNADGADVTRAVKQIRGA